MALNRHSTSPSVGPAALAQRLFVEAAFLVFLARATGARIVAANPLVVADNRLGRGIVKLAVEFVVEAAVLIRLGIKVEVGGQFAVAMLQVPGTAKFGVLGSIRRARHRTPQIAGPATCRRPAMPGELPEPRGSSRWPE